MEERISSMKCCDDMSKILGGCEYCGDLICENCGFEEENENSFNMVSYDIICNKCDKQNWIGYYNTPYI